MGAPSLPAAASLPPELPADPPQDRPSADPREQREKVVELSRVSTRFGDQEVHRDLDLDVRRGEIFAIVGGSGTGKSVLLREMTLLQQPTAGTIRLFGQDTAHMRPADLPGLRRRWGVMFQQGGLFSSLTVRENVALPLHEHTQLGTDLIDRIAEWKLRLTGLPADAGLKLPGALSGGMIKRASLARALVLDPELLFLDEPTSGLDPASSSAVGELILRTHALFGLTIVMVTHDLDLLWQISDRVAVLGERRVLAAGSMDELSRETHPIVRGYFVDSPLNQARTRMQSGGAGPARTEEPKENIEHG